MPASYLHGVECLEIDKGARSIRTVKTAVIGLIGTAPVNDVKDGFKTINKMVLITNEKEAAQYFGTHKPGFTIPSALSAIFEQGSGTIIVINVFDPDKHTDVSDVKPADIIGSVDLDTNQRTGLLLFKDAYSLLGFYPKILIAPTFCETKAVAVQMESVSDNIRSIALVDAPIGLTPQEIITGRNNSGETNLDTSSDRVVLCYPHLKVYDEEKGERLEPYSQRLAGVISSKDLVKGYHYSPSNSIIKGVIGAERQLTAMINDPTSETNLLNDAGIFTYFNSAASGIRTWGNRNASYPSSTGPTTFICVRRVADILKESVEFSMLQYIDAPIDNGLIDTITESVNAFIRSLIGRGALIDGFCKYNPQKNSAVEIANGHLIFDISYVPPFPAERLTFESFIDIQLLKSLGNKD